MKTTSIVPLRKPLAAALTFFALLIALAFPQSSRAVSSTIVIAEVYGGGGNSSAAYQNDYVVLFNRGGSSVDITGWSLQYASAAGTSWTVNTLTTTTPLIPAGAYFLVKLASGGAVGSVLPAADSSPSAPSNMSGTAGKLALVSNTTALTGTCPTGGAIVDFVGYGTTASCFEGSAPTPAPSNTTSVQRGSSGCTETDSNSTDFTAGAPNPRNSASAVNSCTGGAAPTILTQPQGTNKFVGDNVSFSVSASGSAPLSYQWYKGASAVANGGRITGATSTALTITGVTVSDAGDYSVIVTNAFGSATSATATLSVSDSAPIFTLQPQSRNNLTGTPTMFSGFAQGSQPITYRWQKGGVNVSDSSHISGSATTTLNITNVVSGDAGDYTLVASNGSGSTTSSVATLAVNNTGTLVGWDFNGTLIATNPVPSQGSSAGVAAGVFTVSFSNNVASGIDFGAVLPNNAWGSSTYPTQATSNKVAGVQFKVSMAGLKNPAISYDTRGTATASRYQRVQFTTNGIDFIDFPTSTSITVASLYQSRAFDLSGFPGVRNNPNFAIRIVTEFESTASYGATNNANYVAIGSTSSYGTGGTLSYDLVNITADVITDANNPPTVSTITNQSTADTSPITINFTVNDTETAAGSLTVTATSGNQAVISDGQISPGGSGSARTLTITPTVGVTGVAPIIVKVTDANGDIATTWFNLTVAPGNGAPTITGLTHTNTLVGTAVALSFTIGDDKTAVNSLSLSSTSLNTALVPDANVVFSGTGSNRTVTITPAANQTGVAPIRITVNDNDSLNAKTASASFTVMVRPDANVICNDFFDYADGALTTQSFGLWATHSGTAGQIQVGSGEILLTPANTEDVNIPLIGAPYSTNNTSTALYSSFKVRFSQLPTEGGAYFAHFKDDNTGATTGFGARVWASTTNAAAGTFRLTIANGTSATNISGQFPRDLQLGTNYLVVTKFVPSTGLSTIWIDPTSESDSNVTATDPGTDVRPNPINVFSYAFRETALSQGSPEGIKNVDNLKVGFTFSAVTGLSAPASLSVQRNGNNAVLSWSDSSFALQACSTVNGTFTNVTSATSPFTNSLSGAQVFFRLKK